MEIIVGSRSAAHGRPGLAGHPEDPQLGRRQNGMLRALLKAGMSEETALEQIARLCAGDIWCG
ncbi:hypothetical protein [Sinomonas terrae]|uniref:Uncharacterized protein n=1 Tax=Sinomonas terrae TaxID=2908838 RepID=A0ABS9U0C2_9MICC|nr:hypothetical protein [Sinomonas terrae]MCH6470051.1 hypothetical protein [Sinomonas terrae]